MEAEGSGLRTKQSTSTTHVCMCAQARPFEKIVCGDRDLFSCAANCKNLVFSVQTNEQVLSVPETLDDAV